MTEEATAQTMARSGGRLGEAHAADGGGEDVALPDGAPARLSSTAMIMARREASRPLDVAARDGEGRGGDEGLDLGHEGRRPSRVTVTHVPATAGHGCVEEQAARVGQADDADVRQVEAADLVRGAEAVLDRADQAQPGVPVALELDDDVDEVLERPGDRRSSRPW